MTKPSIDPLGELIISMLGSNNKEVVEFYRTALNAYYLSLIPLRLDEWIDSEHPNVIPTLPDVYNAAIEETRKRFRGAASPQEES